MTTTMVPNRSNKRRKTQLACYPCRARKTGCDGHRPCCTLCATRGWQDRCKYQEEVLPGFPLTLATLDRRLQRLEATAQEPQDRRDQRNQQSQQAQQAQHIQHIPVSAAPESRSDESILTSDTLVPTLSPFPTDDDVSPHHESVSNLSFIQQVSAIVRSTYGRQQSMNGPTGGHAGADGTPLAIGFSVPRHHSAFSSSDDHALFGHSTMDLVLPTRQVADHLVECYWELFHPTMPLLHKPTFCAAYHRLWEPSAADDEGEGQTPSQNVMLHAVLNMVLAIGSHHDQGLAEAEREQLVGRFYQRSLRLLSIETIEMSSLELVQLLLLRSIHLLHTPYADRCWTTAGVAFRVAQALGLHVDRNTAALNQLEREMCRRVWHCCVLVDWMTCIAFNQPLALSLSAFPPVTRPALIDDEYLSRSGQEGGQPPDKPSRLAFFSCALDILAMLEKSRRNSSRNSRSTTTTQNNRYCYSSGELGTTVDIISDLDYFLQTLPDHLRTDRPQKDYGHKDALCFQLQAGTLKTRVMYVRLGILRPLIVAGVNRWVLGACGGSTDFSCLTPKERLFMDLYGMCISTAHEVLEWMHGHLGSVHRAAPWHTLYYTFAAATVLVAATLCPPPLQAMLDVDPCKTSWERAIQIFAYHKGHVKSAEKGIEALEKFKEYVARRGQGQEQGRGDEHATPSAESQMVPVDGNARIPMMGSPLASPPLLDTSFVGDPQQDWDDMFGVVPIDSAWFVSQGFFEQ